MKKNDIDFTPHCNRCGKEAPIDEKMSNENWTVYKTSEPCECGGKFAPKFIGNDADA